MGTLHEHSSWVDKYWWLFLIAFGIFCILGLALWHPVTPGV